MEAYNAIIDSVDNDKGGIFFIQGHGRTRKTFLWNTIVTKLRAEKKIVLPVATSSIVVLLLPNGRTAHSRFHIPLTPTTNLVCGIRQGTNLASMLHKTSLIIWDEAPMASRMCFEALDMTLCDILQCRYEDSLSKPFGGLTVMCGGDFRQIFPVIPKGSQTDIIDVALNSSYLWPSFQVFELSANMRLLNLTIDEAGAAKIAAFDYWMLEIGNGSKYQCARDELIHIPPSMTPGSCPNEITGLFEAVYPSFTTRLSDHEYLSERAILTPKNDTVKIVNDIMLEMIPGEGKSYYSCDTVCRSSVGPGDSDTLYPIEFLNSLTFNGVPAHHIHLKVGCPIMILRNLNQTEGLYNRTRLVVTELGDWSIRGTILSGSHAGKEVTIPRIIMCPADSKWPFAFNRRLLPITS